jgi:hypothetical protein
VFFEDCETCKGGNDCEGRKDGNDCKGFNCREEVLKSRTWRWLLNTSLGITAATATTTREKVIITFTSYA